MEFYTSFNEKRPIRLSEATRKFAYESLYEHRYGLDTKKTPGVEMNWIEDFSEMADLDKYDRMIYEIVEKAPIRICEGELVSGAATLGNAINHVVPATYMGETVFGSISHLTIGFGKVLKSGVNGIKKEAEAVLERFAEGRQRRFTESCLHCIECMDIWRMRYISALREANGFEKNAEILERVPMNPPMSFREAVQSIWFCFAFTRLCGNWPGIGRIDEMLGDFLENDLKKGVITIEEAREILAHFFIKGCEWVAGGFYDSGDAQHYQNIVLGGIDENGKEVTNEVTYLVLDIIEELGISDFPTTVRINRNTDKKLIRRAAEVMRYGNGVVAVYNEDLILDALEQYGYDRIEARNFANDGCWEVQIPGKTNFSYHPFDGLAILQHVTLRDYGEEVDFQSFEELFARYSEDLHREIEGIYNWCIQRLENKDGKWIWKSAAPCTVISLFEEGCIEKGASYIEGGPIYNVYSPHIGGIADIANSLYTIKKLVFDEKKLGFRDFMKVLARNWEGDEVLRRYISSRYEFYGNDNDEVDLIAARILEGFAAYCKSLDGRCPISFPPGVSTFGRQIEWAPTRNASAHGRKKGDVLAGNMSPTPGTSTAGATAIIKSYCKSNLRKQVTGTALDIRLLPSDVKGENGLNALISLIRGFTALGGYFMQIDVADTEILREAQRHPENYPALAVRISGWNARFITLSREWQDMIIGNMVGE